MEKLNDYLMETARRVAVDDSLPWGALNERTIVITGGTGLVCSQLVRILISRNDYFDAALSLVLPARNEEKVQLLFGAREDIRFVRWSLGEPLPDLGSFDYLIHAASETSSKAFTEKPATIISAIVAGGEETLDAALRAGVEKYVFLSTMEVYGETVGRVAEGDFGKLDPMVVRNSYPEAKRLVECLCASYQGEFELPTVVLRLAQTFGQGVRRDDKRVFAEFARCAWEGEDIVLLSDGTKRNSYLSVDDAAKAIIVALACGRPGKAYNAANDANYCSVKEMAAMVLQKFGKQGQAVRREHDPAREAMFRKSGWIRLSWRNWAGILPIPLKKCMPL